MKAWLGIGLVALAMAGGGPALAQQTVKFAYVGELTGGGAAPSTSWRDGAILAIEEINAKGGILGRRIELTVFDTQTNPGLARAQMQKAIEDDPYVILGPILSGMVKVSMMLAQQAEIPHFVGGEATDLTQLGSTYLFRT